MTRIGIVGAGVAGVAAAYAIEQRSATVADDVEVTVLEASPAVGGRAAVRRRDGCTYDVGANYLQTDDERVTELVTETLDADGLVEVDGPVDTFDAAGEISPGRDPEERKLTYRSGISTLATRLVERSGATLHCETRVEAIERAGTWRCHTAGGRTFGPFDVLVLTPPAPVTTSLLADAAWEDPTRSTLAAAASSVPYRTIWSGVFHYPFELDVPYYALVNVDREHEVGWLAREECKPGHVPDGETLLVVQAAPDWSAARTEVPPSDVLDELLSHAADLLDDERLRDPDWTDHHCWRHALPDDAVDPEPVREAEAAGCYCAGDWVAGEARLHAALASGLDVGERVIERELGVEDR